MKVKYGGINKKKLCFFHHRSHYINVLKLEERVRESGWGDVKYLHKKL